MIASLFEKKKYCFPTYTHTRFEMNDHKINILKQFIQCQDQKQVF